MKELLHEIKRLIREEGCCALSKRLLRVLKTMLDIRAPWSRRLFLRRVRQWQPRQQDLTLFIDHALGGGTEIFRREQLQKLLRQQQSVLLITPLLLNGSQQGLTLEFIRPDACRSLRLHCRNLAILQESLRNLSIRQIWCNSLVSYSDCEAWLNWLGSPDTAAEKIIFIHDFYPLCPSVTLISAAQRFCGLKNCPQCNASIVDWRRNWDTVLRNAIEVRCFSQSSAQLVAQAYPGLRNITVVPHSMTQFSAPDTALPWPLEQLRLGIVGNTNSVAKGSRILYALAEYLATSNQSLYFVGKFYDPPPANLVVSGEYQRHELAETIRRMGINVVLFPSIWPETFSFVVSELMLLEIPVLAFDVGAQGEKIRSYRWGRLLSSDDPAIIYREAELLFRDYKSHHTS